MHQTSQPDFSDKAVLVDKFFANIQILHSIVKSADPNENPFVARQNSAVKA